MNAIKLYRLANFFHRKRLNFFGKIIQAITFLLYNSKIPRTCTIGRGTYFVCKGIGVAIHDNVVIGENCAIGAGVKITGKSPFLKVPVIHNNVFFGHGSVISGPVIIEDNVIIAANSVVTKSVKSGFIVAGAPAKIIGHKDDLNYNIFKRESFDQSTAPFLIK